VGQDAAVPPGRSAWRGSGNLASKEPLQASATPNGDTRGPPVDSANLEPVKEFICAILKVEKQPPLKPQRRICRRLVE